MIQKSFKIKKLNDLLPFLVVCLVRTELMLHYTDQLYIQATTVIEIAAS